MKERNVDIISSIVLIVFSLIMRDQLDGIPREGVLFPLCVLYTLIAASIFMAARAIFAGRGTLSFFGDIPPSRWSLAVLIFIAQTLGAMFVSFSFCMAVGMFAMLVALTPEKTMKAIFADIAFTLGFTFFFRIFFTDIMHIFFPEPFL